MVGNCQLTLNIRGKPWYKDFYPSRVPHVSPGTKAHPWQSLIAQCRGTDSIVAGIITSSQHISCLYGADHITLECFPHERKKKKALLEHYRQEAPYVAPRAGFEPATARLTAECSAVELTGNVFTSVPEEMVPCQGLLLSA